MIFKTIPVSFGAINIAWESDHASDDPISLHDMAIRELYEKNAALEAKCDTLQQQAEIHAQEARTANATIAECYQAVTGKQGEPGNWNGANPVRERIAELEAKLAEAEKDAERYRYYRDDPPVELSVRKKTPDSASGFMYIDGQLLDMLTDEAIAQREGKDER